MTLILDLDRTIWHVFDKHNNPIWAKQMIEPYHKLDDTIIEDDVGSICMLDNEIPEFLARQDKVYFLSAGGLWGTPLDNQPTIKLLKLFDIYKYFDDGSVLGYKTMNKNEFLSSIGECTFIDDNLECLEKARQLSNVKVIDVGEIDCWAEVII